MSMVDNAHSFAASIIRGPRGLIVKPHCQKNPPRPQQPLELYEFEACPYCRKVREEMSELDLAYVSRTCARGAVEKRQYVKKRGGEAQFPFLIDPNTGAELYESEEIIDYLADEYGAGRVPLGPTISPVNTVFAMIASALRPKGRRVRRGVERREQPDQLPVLYNFEISPYCRKVREKFNELNLDYRVENVAKMSSRRSRLVEQGGKMQVPYLIDPNTGTEMYESDDIVEYLQHQYG